MQAAEGTGGQAMDGQPIYIALIDLTCSLDFLELVKSGLLAALEAIPPASLFGLVTFSHKVNCMNMAISSCLLLHMYTDVEVQAWHCMMAEVMTAHSNFQHLWLTHPNCAPSCLSLESALSKLVLQQSSRVTNTLRIACRLGCMTLRPSIQASSMFTSQDQIRHSQLLWTWRRRYPCSICWPLWACARSASQQQWTAWKLML